MADRSGVQNLVETLDVRRRAAVGFAAGAALAGALYVLFVVVPDSPHPLRFLALGFVVAVTTGLLFTAVLVAHAAYRYVNEERDSNS
ncbi:MAG: hypothetical protein ABEJ68_03150 [Halobacteriaceae archaeon]